MSLKWKTAFILFITSLVFVPVSVEYLLRSESLSQEKIQIEADQTLLGQLSQMADTALSAKDNQDTELSALEQIFVQYSELPHYLGFYLYKNENVLISHAAGLTLPINYQQQPFQQVLTLNNETHLLMIVSPSAVKPDYMVITNNYWLVVLIVILALTLAGYIIGNKFALKVDEIIVGISKAGGGNYSQSIVVEGKDELAQLVVSYNRMLDNMLLASQESKEQLQSYQCILNTASEGIISLNDRGVIQEYNQSAERMFGYLAEEIIGKNISKLIPLKIEKEDGEVIEQNFIGLEEQPERIFEVIGLRKDHENISVELSVSVSTINNSQVYTGILRDVSARKSREAKQKSLEIQLRTLQRQQTVESLTGGIAHDFNNILGPVLGYADMAVTEAEEGTLQHKYLTHILNGAHRARELVARIMSFTRQYEHSREQLHLIKIVEDSLAFLKSSIPTQHTIKTFFNTSNDLVAAESTQLTQVLVAMVTNASQAMSNQSGTLTIRIDNINPDEQILAQSGRLHSGEYVRMRIQDTGIGMDALTRASVFEPFFSTRDKSDGSGLGLSVANGIITNFGGEILVDSELGEGTVFSVFLPVADMQAHQQQNKEQVKPLSKDGELVLYIDDDEVIVELGRDMLESLGYEVAVSVSSEKALEMFRTDPEDFDLIITDQSMPVLTGTQLAKEFRKIRADIPIILVTGFSASILNQDLADSGIEHCISKPVVMNELGEIVLKALSKPTRSN
ncbi:MAG: PAS domain S-box-containing protein [Enterobacterales bacterium]|jgi:PAS domain S-box-containing protein